MALNIKTNTLLFCGAIACPILMIVVIIEGAMRPNYSSFLYPLSSFSIGDNGLIKILNFIFTGILLIVFLFGLKQLGITDSFA